jgi:hypothetical protein
VLDFRQAEVLVTLEIRLPQHKKPITIFEEQEFPLTAALHSTNRSIKLL